MAFKVRRVTSGLSPRAGTARASESAARGGAAGKIPTQNEHFSDDDDPPLHTPFFFRGAGRDTISARAGESTSTDTRPEAVSAEPPRTKAPSQAVQLGPVQSDVEAIRSSKLITDDNVFSPQAFSKAPRLGAGKPQDVEFDSSDHESPFRSGPATHTQDAKFGTKRRLSEGEPEPALQSSIDAVLGKARHTPRRQSPLRKEVVPSSATTASDIVTEIQRSSVVRSQSAQEILEKINMSMDRIRGQSHDGDASDSDLSDKDADLVRKLDEFLPKAANGGSQGQVAGAGLSEGAGHGSLPATADQLSPLRDHFSPGVKDRSRAERVFPEESARARTGPSPFQQSIAEKGSPMRAPKGRAVSAKTSASAKTHASASSHKRRRASPTEKVEPWSYEKWSKLRRLVESSVPNHVISNNELVMRELGCRSKQELAQRIRFLQRKARP